MKKNYKMMVLLFLGLAFLILGFLGASFPESVIEHFKWNAIVICILIIVFIVIGLILVVIAFVQYLKDIERMDVDNYFSEDQNVKFDLKGQYQEYCKTLLPKQKDKNGKPISKKYSTWSSDLLEKYNKLGSTEKNKKTITVDMQHYLKSVHRTVSLVNTVLTAILAPAEIGLVAIVCASEEFGGIITAIIYTLVICILFTITLRVNHKISCFIEDVADVLNITLEGNKKE